MSPCYSDNTHNNIGNDSDDDNDNDDDHYKSSDNDKIVLTQLARMPRIHAIPTVT